MWAEFADGRIGCGVTDKASTVPHLDQFLYTGVTAFPPPPPPSQDLGLNIVLSTNVIKEGKLKSSYNVFLSWSPIFPSPPPSQDNRNLT